MAQVNKISSFKSFTEVKNQEATMKLREENNAKRQETIGKIGAILDEMGLTSLSELDEEKKQALINKMFGNVSEDEAEDIEDELNKLGKPKKLEEGNAFIYAAAKAKNAGKKTFTFNGKTYKVTLKTDTGLKESYDSGIAKESGEDEFEFGGETYEIEESKRTKFTGKTAHDLYTQTGGKPVQVFVGNDWYSVDPKELKDNKGDSFTGYSKDGSDYEFDLKDIDFIQESVVNEARSISKIQYDWSKLTTQMQATAQNWKAAEGAAKESLLGKLKEMTAQKKALEAELDAAIADKDKDLELVVTEAYLNEAQYFKSTKNFIDFLEEIDGMPEHRIKRIMGKDYIDTPGGFRDEADDYDNDIEDYTRSNMGSKDFEKLKTWWENNVQESQVNEAEIKSDDEFKEYAMTVLKKAFGDDFDEAKAGEVVDGILKKCGDDYGAAVGMLTSSLGESVTNEAFDANKRVIELTKLLKKQKFIGAVYPEGDTVNVFVDSGDVRTMMMWDDNEPGKVRMECEDDSYSETIDDNNDAVLNFFSNLDDELDESVTNEAFDANKRVIKK